MHIIVQTFPKWRGAIIRKPPVIVHVRTNLGLVRGVERLGEVLLRAGLATSLGADVMPTVQAPAWESEREHPSRLLNAEGLAAVARAQAQAVSGLIADGRFVVVLGGDDSTLFGTLLALRRRGRFGLVFIDAHYDMHPPEESPSGEASDSDLLLALGFGPDLISDLDGLRPLVRATDVAVIGHRDLEEVDAFEAVLRATGATVFPLFEVRSLGMEAVVQQVLDQMQSPQLDGFFVHIDADVLHDDLMPAVDYRHPDGLQRDEFVELVHSLASSQRAVGVDVTIFNPNLDPAGTAAHTLSECLVAALSDRAAC